MSFFVVICCRGVVGGDDDDGDDGDDDGDDGVQEWLCGSLVMHVRQTHLQSRALVFTTLSRRP